MFEFVCIYIYLQIRVGLRPRGPSEGRNGVYECSALARLQIEIEGWIFWQTWGQRSGLAQLEACTHASYDSADCEQQLRLREAVDVDGRGRRGSSREIGEDR